MFYRNIEIDAYRNPKTEVRLVVSEILVSVNIQNQFIEYERDLNLLWQYLKRVGVRSLVRKVISRMAESKRNSKDAFGGVGIVVEASSGQKNKVGNLVVFFASNHTKKHSTICVDEQFVDSFSIASLALTESFPEELKKYIGWSPYSGILVDRDKVEQGLRKIKSLSGTVCQTKNILVPIKTRLDLASKSKVTTEPNVDAVLFGYGNYAKTQIIPYIRKYLKLSCIHEVDPDQISIRYNENLILDTSPTPRYDEKYSVWFIAGYHHTHADIAVSAIEQGAYAVMEKPLATSWEQFHKLKSIISTCREKSLFFSCFHKRYLVFNDWSRKDLGVSDSEPLDMNCLVYEIPLPDLHWYNWPNSGSRLISNGCHWIDHFMFLNSYSPMVDFGVSSSRSKDVTVFLILENGAHMTLNVTDKGSSRLGVRELVEVRSENASIRIVDSANYEAENKSRVIRRASVNPVRVYSDMYSEICKKIIRGLPGDNIESLRSTEVVLTLEKELG